MKSPSPFLLCLLLGSTAAASSQQTPMAPATREIRGLDRANLGLLTLWYRTPAEAWTDALPVGNGRLGAMIFASPQSDRLQLNDITVWSGGPEPNVDRPEAYKALPAIRAALASGDYAAAQKLEQANMTTEGPGDSLYFPSYETLGDLSFDYKLGPGDITGYRRWLDLADAVSGVDFTVAGVDYHREVFSSAPDHAIVEHLTASRPGSISFTVRLSRIASATTTALGDDTLVMRGDTTYPAQPATPSRPNPRGGPDRPGTPAQAAHPGNVDYEAQLRVKISGGSIHAEGDRLIIAGANQATLLLAAGTSYALDFDHNYRGADPHSSVAAQLRSASSKPYPTLKAAHIADYRLYFDRVSFHLPTTPAAQQPTGDRLNNYGDGTADPALAVLYYQMGRYLLISSSRPDNPLPSNSQGIWGDGLDLPWRSDYKANINYEMNYWPSETANLGELHLPAIRLDASLVKPGMKTAQTYYNAPGWALAFTTNAWGWTSPGPSLPFGPFFEGGAWVDQDIWEHYAFSRDRDFLAKYYPVLKGSAEFYLSILVPDANGKLITSPSVSPENTFKTDKGVVASVVDGSAVEREIIWDLFTNTITASRVLGQDEEFRAKLEAAKAAIRPLEIGKAGQLEEWGHDWDLNAPDIHHRHVSHLFAAYPGWEISPETNPELAAAVTKSLALRGDEATGWSNAWKINLYARLRNGDHAFKILGEQLRLATAGGRTDYHGAGGGTYTDMLDAHPPFQIDGNFGGTSGIDEMLMQSSQRYSDRPGGVEDSYYIDLLPALPSLWADGSMHGLRARGGFELDLDWQHGQLTSAKLRNVAGTSTRLRYAGETIPVTLRRGQELSITMVGGKMHLSPASAAHPPKMEH